MNAAGCDQVPKSQTANTNLRVFLDSSPQPFFSLGKGHFQAADDDDEKLSWKQMGACRGGTSNCCPELNTNQAHRKIPSEQGSDSKDTLEMPGPGQSSRPETQK